MPQCRFVLSSWILVCRNRNGLPPGCLTKFCLLNILPQQKCSRMACWVINVLSAWISFNLILYFFIWSPWGINKIECFKNWEDTDHVIFLHSLFLYLLVYKSLGKVKSEGSSFNIFFISQTQLITKFCCLIPGSSPFPLYSRWQTSQ